MPHPIDEKHALDINGSEQWIFARGSSQGSILFFIHGGPGFPLTPIARAFEKPLMKDHLVVHWDQRGAGKSFQRTDFVICNKFSLEQFVLDGIKVAEEIRSRHPGRPLILIGHSWGTMLGAKMAAARPDLFIAYVSIGTNADSQASERYRYQYLLEKMRAEGQHEDLTALAKTGPPPFDSIALLDLGEIISRQIPLSFTWGKITEDQIERAWLTAVEAGDYSERELEDTLLHAFPESLKQLHKEYASFSAEIEVPRIEIPVAFLHGRLDFNTPLFQAKKYFEKLDAPSGKKWIELEEHAHMVMFENPGKLSEIVNQLAAGESFS